MEGEHLCKTMRGVKKKGIMRSSYFVGEFKNNNELRLQLENAIRASRQGYPLPVALSMQSQMKSLWLPSMVASASNTSWEAEK